jgi:type IV pilus assembly protein PilW
MDVGRARRQVGHVLLEWLIATALGLVVQAGTLTLYRSHRESIERSIEAARMREAGAAALTLVGQQIQMAGYAPLDQPVVRARVLPGIAGCQSARPVLLEMADGMSCEYQPSHSLGSGSDAVIVRYADDGVSTWRGASGEPTDCLGQSVPRDGRHAVIVNAFYVARAPRRQEPELYCIGNGHRWPQPLVEGVDRMELRYWLRGAGEPIRARALAPAQWAEVVAVDLCVVVRGQRASGARAFVDCEGRAVRSPDGKDRVSFSRRLMLRNSQADLP